MSIFQQISSKNFRLVYKNTKFKEKIFHYSRYFSSKKSLNEEIINGTETNRSYIPFQEKIRKRKSEAKKSLIVQVESAQSFKELYSYCSSFGSIKQMFHYSTGIEPMHFILVEFQQIDGVEAALSSGTFVQNYSITPTQSQFLWFRAGTKKFSEKNQKKLNLEVTDGTKRISDDILREELQNCESLSDQIKTLYDMSRLTDLESRLRFLTARQIEMSLSGMFPNAQVLPFGSSVNGFGKRGCDLDLVLTLNDRKENPDSRLIFHCKESSGGGISRSLEAIADISHLFLPGCTRFRKILQARVPIIKYHQKFTDVECDLSMFNVSGVHMSDFLYMMGSLDPRVRPLVFAIRRWAKDVGLTNSSPGRWITNFSLTLLVIFFLQRPLHSSPILPSLNTLVKSAGSEDSFITEEGVNCTFLRNIDKLHHTILNTENLETLLYEFFEYYSQFDFKTKSICLNEAVVLSKPDSSPLYIVNPLERGLNVSKNVSLEELDKFKEEVRSATWMIQSTENANSAKWGLLSILKTTKYKQKLNINKSKNYRLMHVKELFIEGENVDEFKEIEFKNSTVKKQVDNIKKKKQELHKTLKNLKEPNR